MDWRFDNTYARLPEMFSQAIAPTKVEAPSLVVWNQPLAEELTLASEPPADGELADVLSGNRLPDGAEPIAQAYAGHQFGGFTMLGDGRAILLGEHLDSLGNRFDIQLKGSGRTRYSRSGDGRAAVGPMLREYLISEAMHALGIPTTRSLAVVATGEPVYREVPLPGAVLTRVAASHLRVGTFQYVAAQRDDHHLKVLADYAIDRHYPDLVEQPNRYVALLRSVVERQAELVAQWMLVGFVHGVMNTDNVSIAGETIDYGPCAFMDRYDPGTVFSSIDSQGRYAYGNQPAISQWNLARFAETLIPLMHDDPKKAVEIATEAIESFSELYEESWLGGMRRKLGWTTREPGDRALIQELLDWMTETRADYTNTLRGLSTGQPRSAVDSAWHGWHSRWLARLQRNDVSESVAVEQLKQINPAVIPRNHLVEESLVAAEQGDLSLIHELLEQLADPFTDAPAESKFCTVPSLDAPKYRTFCGT
ncbi:MAG: YdiU family protein [Planctomycetota bacterium]